MKKIIFILSIVVSSIALGQGGYKQNYAEKLNSVFDFVQSSKVFEELAKKDVKKGNTLSENILKSARAYYFTRNYKKSAELYGMFTGSFSKQDSKNYLDALVRNSDYVTMKNKELVFQKQDPSFSAVELIDFIKSVTSEENKKQKILELDINSGMGDYGSSFIDGKFYFASNRSDIGYTHNEYGWDGLNYSNLYVRNNEGKVILVKEFSTKYHDGPISIDQSGNYYLSQTSLRKKGDKHVKVIVFDSLFNQREFEFNNDEYNVGHVTFSPDFKNMYFASDMPGGKGGSDIYYCLMQSNGKWSVPVNMEEVNTEFDELFPAEDLSGIFYFSSNGHKGLGGLDIFSYSDGKVENFGAPVNSSGDDFSLTFNEEKSGYFTSDRSGNIDRIYSFESLLFNGVLEIIALHAKSGIPISDLEVKIVDRSKPEDTLSYFTNSDGLVQIPISSGKDYIVLGQKKDYELKSPLYLNTDALQSNEVIKKNLLFNQRQYDILVKTIDKNTGDYIGNVTGEFLDPATGVKIPYKTNESGLAWVNVDNYKEYSVTARKKGYLDLSIDVQTSSETLIELDLTMEEIKKDITFKIENIFYDLDKWTLRDTSKYELDKLVEFLQLNDNIVVELSSHTDSRGSDPYNQKLSQRRAQSCVDYLIEKGIPSAQIIARGYGESKLVNRCSNGVICTEEEHQENRRTEIRILQVK